MLLLLLLLLLHTTIPPVSMCIARGHFEPNDSFCFSSLSSRFTPWGKKDDEEQLDGCMELGVTPGVKDMVFSDLQCMPQGFENPLYGSSSTVSL